MASVKVKFRPSSVANKEGTIYYQIIHERKPRQVATEYRILPSEWDEKRLTVAIVDRSDREAYVNSVRERIRWDIERLTKIIHKLDSEGFPYTSNDVVVEFNRYANEYTLFNYMQSVIVILKKNGKIRTSETYAATLKSFKKFRNGEDISLDEINSALMTGYENWLRLRGIAANTISFYARILRAVYNRAVEEEVIQDRHPFRHIYTGYEKTPKRAVPLRIIKQLKTLDLSQFPLMDFARDMFMLSFMLRGMSFIDMAYLTKSDMINGYIVYRRRKTGQKLKIEWTDDMQRILDKYPKNPTRYLLPIIRNPNANERFAYRNKSYYVNYNLKKVGKMIGLTNPLTLYVARHSWASAAKIKGIPLKVISEGMGHDSETTTQIYLASLDNSVIDKANSVILKSLD